MAMDPKWHDIVAETLAAYFGEAKPSLTVGGTRRRKNLTYYYRVEEDSVLEVQAFLRERFGKELPSVLKELKTEFSERNAYVDFRELCASLYERDDALIIKISTVCGIRFHPSYGQEIVASLYTAKEPELELWIDNDGNLFRATRSRVDPLVFNWWVNKCLRSNWTIRSFMVQLLRRMGEARKILLDVARTIENDGFFFPPLLFSELTACHTPKEVLERSSNCTLDVNYNKLDLNVGYYLNCLAEQFDEKDRAFLRDYPKQDLPRYIGAKDLYEGPNRERFLACHYAREDYPGGLWNIRREIEQEVHDYDSMCSDFGETPQIFSSYGTFREKHDELAERYRLLRAGDDLKKPLVPEKSKFTSIAQRLESEGLEWIQTGLRLHEEGTQQHNCAFSYRRDIRLDECAIFHLDRSNQNYTIRVIQTSKGRFAIAEMRARFNAPCRKDDFDFVNDLLRTENYHRLLREEDGIDYEGLFGTDALNIPGLPEELPQ